MIAEEGVAPDGRPMMHPLSREEWRAWLQANQASSQGVWLVSFKEATGKPRIDYDEAVEELLCFGWVDSKPGKLDEERSLLWCAPRKARSGWSRPNKQRVERLIAAGLMQERGLAAIEAAKANGSWTLLDTVEDLLLPEDLAAALAAAGSAERWEAMSRSARRGVLEWITQARRPETRAARIQAAAEAAKDGRAANAWRPPTGGSPGSPSPSGPDTPLQG
ncbi:MAG: YdeI/OmpD-associated family protein [Dehalococcoidia bacterium]